VPSHAPEHAPDQPGSLTNPLARERAHLAASRTALRAMRADVEALDLRDVAASWVNAEALHHQVSERIKALADLSHTPLFFGRLDYLHAPDGEAAEGAESAEGESFYIGRRHVHDADGDPMVIDWRAPVSQPFYQASKKAPMDVGCAAASATRAAN
jgi:DNA helicase IV